MQSLNPLPTAQASRIDLDVRLCSSWKELEEIRFHWDDLLERNQALAIFSSLDWLRAWWHAYGAEKQLFALLFFTPDRTLVGIAPLYLDTIRLSSGWSLRVMRLVGDGSNDSEGLDFIIRRGLGRLAMYLLLLI
jgi:CelD/BcsL family acetyltransferase involved in cellulose biosynthesis